jgi:hypothetical protein
MPKLYTLYQKNTNPYEFVNIHIDDMLTTPVVDNANEYDVSVVQFSMPNFYTQLFTFIDDLFWMSLSYNGHTVYTPVIFESMGNNPSNRRIWEIPVFMKMLNTTIKTLQTNYTSTYGSLPTTNMPYFYYNCETQLIEFTTEMAYFQSDILTPIKIGLNTALLVKLSGYAVEGSYNYTHGGHLDKFWNMLIMDFISNQITRTIGGSPVTFLVIKEQGLYADNIVDIEGIVIKTNLPVKFEMSRQATGLPILTSYLINDINIQQFRNRIVYNPMGPPWRQIPLMTGGPISSIICDIYGVDGAGNLIQMDLGYNQSVSVKLMFTKKNKNPYGDGE